MRDSSQFNVNLSHLSDNLKKLKKLAPDKKIIFMVKSDAYGHGLLSIVDYAYHNLQIREFGCASLGEAMTIRRELKDFKGELLVFSDNEILDQELRENYLNYRIIPVIHHLEDLEVILKDQSFKNMPLYLHFNTGMNRLGIAAEEVEKVIQLLKRFNKTSIRHLMSHFANSYLPLKEGDRTHQQYQCFKKLKAEIKRAGITVEETSMANSGAIEQNFSLEESHIRPGLMLYGPASFVDKKGQRSWSGKSLSSLETVVLDVRRVKKGTPLGYGSHICHRDGLLVILPLGYGDGFLTYYSKVRLRQKGFEGQVIGRVNMDLTMILFPTEAEGSFVRGERFRLWESAEEIESLSEQAKTIPYQLFCAISIRIPRVYSLE